MDRPHLERRHHLGGIAALRAYEITGDRQYLALARTNFDAMYARAWTSEFGGGMWWTTKKTQKDVTTTAPATIAACMLFKDTHDAAYLAKAKTMYAWMRANLYDTSTGGVYDHVSHKANGKGRVVYTFQLTYNQGTFIGSADLLYQLTGDRSYYDDALRTLRHARARLTRNGILRSEANGKNQNGGGFKGIFVRYAVRFARDHHLTEFEPWFALNASAALEAPRRSRPDGRGLGAAHPRQSPALLVGLLGRRRPARGRLGALRPARRGRPRIGAVREPLEWVSSLQMACGAPCRFRRKADR